MTHTMLSESRVEHVTVRTKVQDTTAAAAAAAHIQKILHSLSAANNK